VFLVSKHSSLFGLRS